MLKTQITLDPIKLMTRFFTNYKAHTRKSVPSKFVALVGDIEAYVRFNGNIGNAIDCVFGARYCSTSDLTSYLFDKEIFLSGEGKVEIHLNKIVGVLPKIDIELRSAQVYRNLYGFYFKWKMPNVLTYLSDLFDHTIGKIPGMPRLR